MGSRSSSSYLLLLLLSAAFFHPRAPVEGLHRGAAHDKVGRKAVKCPQTGFCPTPSPPPPPPVCTSPPPPPPVCITPPPPPPPVCITPPPPPSTPIRVKMVYPYVQAFKQRIDIDPKGVLKTWKGTNVCDYKGFSCLELPDKRGKGVTGADFNGFGFKSNKSDLSLGGFIEKLDDLIFFHANSNGVTNNISTSMISKLRFFYELDLSNNKLTGLFPREVLDASLLTFLDLRFNDLRGPLPPEVFDLDLRALFLNNNGFSGNIPHNLGRTPVFYLTLSSNKLVGPIPSSLGTGNTSKTLIEVLLLDNCLSGCLPYQIGLLNRTTVFDASINKLMGPIPRSFSCLREMRLLNLSYNMLSGAVPETVCQLPNLISLSLQHNYFTQVGPKCRKLISSNKLDVTMNCIIDLPSQRDPLECKKFYSDRVPCPSENLMSRIPCKLDHLHADVHASKSDPAQEIAQSPTYAALDRNYRYNHN